MHHCRDTWSGGYMAADPFMCFKMRFPHLSRRWKYADNLRALVRASTYVGNYAQSGTKMIWNCAAFDSKSHSDEWGAHVKMNTANALHHFVRENASSLWHKFSCKCRETAWGIRQWQWKDISESSNDWICLILSGNHHFLSFFSTWGPLKFISNHMTSHLV